MRTLCRRCQGPAAIQYKMFAFLTDNVTRREGIEMRDREKERGEWRMAEKQMGPTERLDSATLVDKYEGNESKNLFRWQK